MARILEFPQPSESKITQTELEIIDRLDQNIRDLDQMLERRRSEVERKLSKGAKIEPGRMRLVQFDRRTYALHASAR